MTKKHFETRAIHAGQEDDIHQSLNPPLYMSSTFTFKDVQQADDTFSFKRLKTFSTSIIASSTNDPIAIVIPPRVIVLIVIPIIARFLI